MGQGIKKASGLSLGEDNPDAFFVASHSVQQRKLLRVTDDVLVDVLASDTGSLCDGADGDLFGHLR